MTKAVKIIIFIYFFGLLTSCKKDFIHSIHGKVTNTSTGSAIEDATVVLQYWNASDNSNPYLYDSVYTDANGNFYFKRSKKILWQYRLTVKHPDYYNGYEDIDQEKSPYNFSLKPR